MMAMLPSKNGLVLMLALALAFLVPRAGGAAGISALQSGAIWPMAGRNQYHTGQSPFAQTGSRSATGAAVAWSVKLSTGFNPATSVFASPVIGNDGSIYVGCNDGYMYAVEPASRKLMWSYKVGSPIYSTAALGQQGTLFFAANDNRVYSLRALNGTLAWSRATTYTGPFDFRGSPVLDSAGNVFIGAPDGSIWKFSPSGTLMWTFNSNPFSTKIQGNLAYYRQNNVDHLLWLAGNSNGEVAPRLVVTDTTTTQAPSSYQNNQQLGTAKAALSSPLVDVSKGHAYFATDDTNTLFDILFDANDQSGSSPVSCCGTGTSLSGCSFFKDNDHVCNVMGNAITTPALGEYAGQRQVFWGTIGNGLATKDNTDYQPFFYSYDIVQGKMASQYRIGAPVQGSPVVDSNGVVYVPLQSGQVVALAYSYATPGSLQTVTQRWALTLPGAPALFSSLAISADGYIIAGANDGTLYAISSTYGGSKLSSPSCVAGQGISSTLSTSFHADITAFDGSSSFCAQCTPGHYAGGSTNVCSPCTSGSYTTLPGMTTCSPCGVGTYAGAFGSTACTSCPVGTKGDTLGLSVCTSCATGKFADVLGLSACKDCGVGTSSLVGSSSCSACDAGKYADTPGLAACKTCNKGFYSKAGAVACIACPIGSTSSDDFSACIVCPAGRFAEKAGSDCSKCALGAISSDDRQSCLSCLWPRFTSAKGQPTCDSFIVVPWSNEFDKSSVTVLAVILGSLSFFYVGMLACSESTSDDEIQFTGNIVTRAGVAFWVFPINAALLIVVLYALTKNHASAGTLAAMLACLLLPAGAYAQFLRDYHVVPYGSQDSAAEGQGAAARAGVALLRAIKFFLVVVPWGLLGLGCYASRAFGVKRVWHVWYRAFTGKQYLGTYDKFNSRFFNHCDRYVLQLQLLPQLIVVIISEVLSSFTLLGLVAMLVLLFNIALVAHRLYTYGGNMDAPLSLHFAAFDVTFLHVDPTVVDENDDSPLEQGVVRGTIIFNGEEIAECGEAEVPKKSDIVLGRVTKDSPHDASLLNLGGLLTFTQSLVMGQEELPTATILPLGRATRIFEAVPSLTPQGTQNAGIVRAGAGRGGGMFGGLRGGGPSAFAARPIGQGIASDPRNYAGDNL